MSYNNTLLDRMEEEYPVHNNDTKIDFALILADGRIVREHDDESAANLNLYGTFKFTGETKWINVIGIVILDNDSTDEEIIDCYKHGYNSITKWRNYVISWYIDRA